MAIQRTRVAASLFAALGAIAAIGGLAIAPSCGGGGGSAGPPPSDAAGDAAPEVAIDAAPDTATDAGIDVPPARTDAGIDAPPVAIDAGIDAPPVVIDAGVDAPPRVVHDLVIVPLAFDGNFGRVTSAPAGIDCRLGGAGRCNARFAEGEMVTLTATSDAVATFDGWTVLLGSPAGGARCEGSVAPCTLALTDATDVGALYCTPACAAGVARCSADGRTIEACGQFDDDRCLELGAPTPCPAGQRCTPGGCVPGAARR